MIWSVVVTKVTGCSLFVTSVLVPAIIGSQAPGPCAIGCPSCAITVGRLFMYSTTAGATVESGGSWSDGSISGAQFVGEGRVKLSVDSTHCDAMGFTVT